LAERINNIAAANSNLNIVAARAALEIDKALDILNDTEDTRAMADIASQHLQTATNYAAAQEPAQQLETYFNVVIERHNVIQECKDAAEQVMAEAGAILAQATAAAQQAQAAAAQEAARKKAAEAAQQLVLKQAEEAALLRPKILQVELDMVDRARGANGPLIAQRKFENAAQSIVKIKANLTQPEAQAYFQNVQAAYQAMAKLKAFVIGAIQKAPYPGGWTTGGTPHDIIRANASQGLTIMLGKSGSIDYAWEKVPVPQLVKIANHYLETANLTDEARANMVLAMALFCYENGGFKLAETHATKACELNPALKSEAQRLMPGFAEDSGGNN